MTARILVVDDEPAILDALTYALEREGYEVAQASDGPQGLERARREPFDAVVLDLMLPGLPGTEVARRLRGESAVPILMLTAKGSEVDKIVGLEVGADDYLTKPFSMAELLARLRAVLRRRDLDRDDRSAVRRVGRLEIDLDRHEVRLEGAAVAVTPSELRILALLSSEPGHVFSRRELIQMLWHTDFVGGLRACDTHVANLRRKIERDPHRPERLLTVRGSGYKLLPV